MLLWVHARVWCTNRAWCTIQRAELVKGRLDLRWVLKPLLFLFHLHGAHPAERLFTLDTFFLACLEHLFVLYAELATLDIETVEGGHDGVCICRLAEISEGEAAELTRLVKMIVERVRCRD